MNFVITTVRISFLYILILSHLQHVLCVGNTYSELSKLDWSHQVVLDQDQRVTVKWKHSEETDKHGNILKWITMEVFAPTNGYVGLGFSPNGAMKGSDIVIGWVDENGTAHLKDFYGVGNFAPKEDASQDYELISALENPSGTTIRFKRLWDTCDEDHDMKIQYGTTQMIWAYGISDPVSTSNQLIMDWHGARRRGVRSVFLTEDTISTPFPDELHNSEVQIWDFTMGNVTVHEEETTYYCRIVKYEHENEGKKQMIGWKPILKKETIEFLHHLVFYECKVSPEFGGADLFEQYRDHPGGRCFTPDMPSDWIQHCISFLFVWVKGGQGEMFPEHVGHPLGTKHGGATYFMVETHYDNPTRKSFVDDSGVRIFYTDKLRQYDGATMMMGYSISPFLTIPPAQPTFNIYGICSSECTKNGIPPEGIKLVTVLLHAHLAARKIRLRHIRNGKELKPIAEDNFYDFNYQQSRFLRTEVTILPGDELITECEYETVQRNAATYGGFASSQEMCQSFLFYYPRIKMNGCRSQYEFYSFLNGMGIQNVTGDVLEALHMPYDPKLLPKKYQEYEPEDDAKQLENEVEGNGFSPVFGRMNVTSPSNYKYNTVGEFILENNWRKSISFAKSMENTWRNGLHYTYCTAESRRRIPMKSHIIPFTDIREPYKREESAKHCGNEFKGVPWLKNKLEEYTISSGDSTYLSRALKIVLVSTLMLHLFN